MTVTPAPLADQDELRLRLGPYARPVGIRYHLIESPLARWLLDLERHRYQTIEIGAEPERAAMFGKWHEFRGIEVQPGGIVLIQPAERSRALLRFRAVRSEG